MAIALQDPNLVWQKVGKALANANPVSQNAFKALKLQMSTSKLNAQLQFVPFDGTATGSAPTRADGGYSPIVGACHVYGIWGRKNGTGTTASFLSIHDQASGSTGNSGATSVGTLWFKANKDEAFMINPNPGIVVATDLVLSAATTVGGTTETTGTSDAADGFVIIGA